VRAGTVLRVESQRFLAGGTISVLFFAAALACFSARFSLRDLPAFLDMCCRGDLSAMAAPLLGAWLAPQARQYASCGCRALSRHPGSMHAVRTILTMGTPFEGSVKAAVLFNSGWLDLFGRLPLRIPTEAVAALARTLPGLHDLLPTSRCLQADGDVVELTDADVEALGGDRELAEESLRFGRRMRGVPLPEHRLVAGINQPTDTSLRIKDGIVYAQ
jgi:hypothetical protein